MDRRIYADNAATTHLDPAALEAMLPFLQDDYGNASQSYAFARGPRKALQQARETIADCIGAHPEEIYFTSGGTESNNLAIKGSPTWMNSETSMATSAFEHYAVLRPCDSLARLGRQIAYVRPSRDGYVTPQSLSACISGTTSLTSIMFANNELGTIQPIKELCLLAHQHGSLFHTDAVQAVGHAQINVQDLGIDMLSASAHKFNGPKGTGFLYVRNGVKLEPCLDGGTQESGLRAGTENIAGIVGMAVALQNNCRNLEMNERHVRELESSLLDILERANLRYVRNGGIRKLPGILSLSFPERDGEAIMHRMDLAGISIATGSACSNGNVHVSHVLRSIGLEDPVARSTIRISLGKDNTTEEIATIGQSLCRILSGRTHSSTIL